MKYQVIKPFIDLDGSCKTENDFVEVDDVRAAKLRRYKLIGRTVSEELPEAVPATEQEPILIAASSGAIPATEQEPVLALDLTDTNHNKSNNKNKTSKK